MKKLSLQSGVKRQLQFPDETRRDRYQVTVIGYVEGRSLMITAPQKNSNFILLREDHRLPGTGTGSFARRIQRIDDQRQNQRRRTGKNFNAGSRDLLTPENGNRWQKLATVRREI
ncbi:MAG: flagellar brake protein [Gammaproteobacteria bacterium]|nr:flagellar brake protein [Gammaproteobacteria bacterium]